MKPSHMAVVAIAVGSFWVGTKLARCEESSWTTTGGIAGSQLHHKDDCALATIAPDKAVTVDWGCVKIWAQHYREGNTAGYNNAIAHVLQAIHDGEAVGK